MKSSFAWIGICILMPVGLHGKCIKSDVNKNAGVFQIVAKTPAQFLCISPSPKDHKSLKSREHKPPGCFITVENDISEKMQLYIDTEACELNIGQRLPLVLVDKSNACCLHIEDSGAGIPFCPDVLKSKSKINELDVICSNINIRWIISSKPKAEK